MWSRARYDLGLTEEEFYRLTPRQYSLLIERYREDLVQREMVAALTTAAVINHGPYPPSEYVSWTAFAPHFAGFQSGPVELTEEQRRQIDAHNTRAMLLAQQMREEKTDE